MKGTILVVNVPARGEKPPVSARVQRDWQQAYLCRTAEGRAEHGVHQDADGFSRGRNGPIYAYRREYRAADSRGARCSSDQSARSRDDDRDGITYLINALKHGIRTTLSETYAAEILRQLGAGDLQDALVKARAGLR